jgi:hypothetical protein
MNATHEPIEFTRIKHDTNGNPRYVCHYHQFLTDKDNGHFEERYKLAVKRANKLGGRKFHNKQYGGGIVFQSYNTADLEKHIHELMQQYA